MFKTIEDLQKFIIWAKSQKVKSLKIDNIEFELSELSFLPDDQAINLKEAIGDTIADTEPLDTKEEEDLLFWSAQK